MSDIPKSIQVSQDPKGLQIEWQDGHRGVYSFKDLRAACPCALCKGERLPFDSKPTELPSVPTLPANAYEAKDLFKVGNYAIGFKWGDGHDTGIYTFDYLRKSCSCKICHP